MISDVISLRQSNFLFHTRRGIS